MHGGSKTVKRRTPLATLTQVVQKLVLCWRLSRPHGRITLHGAELNRSARDHAGNVGLRHSKGVHRNSADVCGIEEEQGGQRRETDCRDPGGGGKGEWQRKANEVSAPCPLLQKWQPVDSAVAFSMPFTAGRHRMLHCGSALSSGCH